MTIIWWTLLGDMNEQDTGSLIKMVDSLLPLLPSSGASKQCIVTVQEILQRNNIILEGLIDISVMFCSSSVLTFTLTLTHLYISLFLL